MNEIVLYKKESPLSKIEQIEDADFRMIPLDFAPEWMSYYISKEGKVYSCYLNGDYYHVIAMKRVNDSTAIKGPKIRISSGKYQRNIYLKDLLYWTYVLGYCDTSIDVKLRDGDKENLSIENLYVEVQDNEGLSRMMGIYQDIYDKEYKSLSLFISKYRALSLFEAEDCVSKSFIDLCSWCDELTSKRDFIRLWINRAKLESCNRYHYKILKLNDILDIKNESLALIEGKEIETFEFLSIFNGKKQKYCLEMYLKGYTAKEISEISHEPFKLVNTNLFRAKKRLKEYLAHDVSVYYS